MPCRAEKTVYDRITILHAAKWAITKERSRTIQKEHGRKHLTKEQMRQVLARKDAVAEKNIPDSARRQMAHRPYQQKGEAHGRERTDEIPD